jgi:branched-chain amino acid transport system permease protein
MFSEVLSLVPAGIINGLMFGAIYALVALGLTLIYGVLHIINFAHGAMLMLAMYMAYFLFKILNIDPYVAILIVTPAGFVFGYTIYRWGIGKLSGGRDQNILLITLGLSIILENSALVFFSGDQQTISLPYSYEAFDLGFLYLSYPKVISFVASLLICLLLWMLMTLTDLGKAIRAVAKQREGARLVGIDVEHVFAVTFGIGVACLGAAGCMLLPIFYVDPYTGNIFVIVAFTIVVLGGMGSIVGALLGGFIIGITESVCGLILGESLGQVGISLIFILILIFKPTGIFGSKV